MPDFKAINIRFEHIATANSVEFIAWITNFEDTYTSNWNPNELYGRMDPMMTFKNTSRKISLGWDVVAEDLFEAKGNMAKISEFIQMQYPTYAKGSGAKGGGGASMIGSPPLIRAKFLNWVGSSLSGKGLVCALAGVSFKPNLEHGTFGDGAGIYPQSFALSVEMTVLHEHPLGYHEGDGGRFGSSGFPYRVDPPPNRPVPPAPPATGKEESKSGIKTDSDETANEQAVLGEVATTGNSERWE